MTRPHLPTGKAVRFNYNIALKNLPEAEKELLKSYLYRASYTAEDLEQVRKIFVQAGSVKYLSDLIADKTAQAQNALVKLPDAAERSYLSELANYLINREK